MNVYIFEDENDILKIKNTVRDAFRFLKREWGNKYDDVRIISMHTPKIEILEHFKKNESKQLVETLFFEDNQEVIPDILILDWELFWGEKKTSYNGGKLLELVDTQTKWNPYVIFTSSKSPSELLDIMGGDSLFRILPTSIMLLSKDFLAQDDRNHYSFEVVQDALKQGIDYATIHNLRLKIYPFPIPESYKPKENIIDGKKVFTHASELFTKSNTGNIEHIIFPAKNIFAIVKGINQNIGIILFENEQLNLYMLALKKKDKTSKIQYRPEFQFLNGTSSSSTGIYYNDAFVEYNEKFIFKTTRVEERQKKRLIDVLDKHLRVTDKYYDQCNADIDHGKINPFYKAIKNLI